MDISAAEFSSRYKNQDSFFIIDVREELEYQTFNIGGDSIPLGNLLNNVEGINYPKDAEIVIICQRGLRSETARRALSKNGYSNVRNLDGGILALRKIRTFL